MTTATHTPDLLALVGMDTHLRKVASTCNGEYAGPCPRCGGQDRLRVQPNAEPYPRWMCRQCSSDRWQDDIAYVMFVDGVHYKEACARLGYEGAAARAVKDIIPDAPEVTEPPAHTWQVTAQRFLDETRTALWADAGAKARAWLVQRGIDEYMALMCDLGYNPRDQWTSRHAWGLDDSEEHSNVWLPRGIVIPWIGSGDQVWRINIRRPLTSEQIAAGEKKYWMVSGSTNGLYGVQWLAPSTPAVLVESELDALAIQSVCDDLVGAAATGSTHGSRRMRWITTLALCRPVLVAFDNDDDEHKGEAASRYWLDVLGPNACRWRPWLKDVGEMVEQQMDIRGWIEAGLADA